MIRLFHAIHKSSINQRFREKRFRFFKELMETIPAKETIRILDVGGTQSYWENMDYASKEGIHITLLNVYEEDVTLPNFKSLRGDATDLSQFADQSFDIVHSNSVIEHLYTLEAQQKMAREIQRVGVRYYVQTPNRYFPVEPHWVLPLFQFLPFSWRVFITRKFYLDSYPAAERSQVAIDRVKEVRLLTEGDMKALFPGGKIFREMFLGLKKSIISYSF
ncbi:MAG: class I SAM-dependent methyltransferase [Cyclobacteriaceae bacterium]|nr:class I SAM-dependent methyltransferase [Cyclobacteriaceae bacterium]